MSKVVVRYWAGAKKAAGVAQENVDAATVTEALAAAVARRDDAPGFQRVLDLCSLLIDGARIDRDAFATTALKPGSVIEVLPPFAGG